MQRWKIFVAFALACLIFIGLVVSENRKFELVSRLKNPFDRATSLDGKIFVDSEEKEIFTQDGELFHLSAGTELDFSPPSRQILSGSGFVSGVLIGDRDFRRARRISVSPDRPFSQKNIAPRVAQLQIGPIFVNFPGATIFFERDAEKRRSEIAVFGRSVEIFWETATRPFVIPPGFRVSIRERLISPKTSEIFYTKLKKEFRMRRFFVDFSLPSHNLNFSEKFGYFLQSIAKRSRELERFVSITPEIWSIGHVTRDKFLGELVYKFQKIQEKYAIGIPPENLATRKFQSFIDPLLQSRRLLKRGNKKAAEAQLNEFLSLIRGWDWADFLAANAKIEKMWGDFDRAQSGFLRSVHPESPERIFFDIPKNSVFASDFEWIDREFSEVEMLISNRFFIIANKKMSNLSEKILKLENPEKFKFKITKIRRLLVEILKSDSFFRKKDWFQNYSSLVEVELVAYAKNPIFLREIRLESAQDSLRFLAKLFEKNTDAEVAKILLKIYKKLDIPAIVRRLGREIFTASELETIDFVAFVGASGLTGSEMAAIRDAQARQREFSRRISALKSQFKSGAKMRSSAPIKIVDESGLMRFFEENGIGGDEIATQFFEKNGEPFLILFSDASIDEIAISGTFVIPEQKFKVVKIDEFHEKNVPVAIFPQFVRQKSKKIKATRPRHDQKVVQSVPQNTTTAVLERKLVAELFRLEGFSVARRNVQILDPEMTIFRLKNARFGSQQFKSFEYHRDDESVRRVVVRDGEDPVNFGSEIFPRKNSGEILTKKLKSLAD